MQSSNDFKIYSHKNSGKRDGGRGEGGGVEQRDGMKNRYISKLAEKYHIQNERF